MQPMDNKHYVAVSYVGIEGVPFDKIQMDISNSAQEEEEKNQATKANDFQIKFQNLMLRSNKNSEQSALIDDQS
jgi:hypothetical protein